MYARCIGYESFWSSGRISILHDLMDPVQRACGVSLLQVYSTRVRVVTAIVPWPGTNVIVTVTTPRGRPITTSTAMRSV